MKHAFFIRTLSVVVIFSSLILLTGCGRYVCWAEKTFKVADTVCVDFRDVQEADVRFAPMRYSIGMTAALPRVMYRSNQVISIHEQLRAECDGISEKKVTQELEKLHAENDLQTVFFVSIYENSEQWGFTLYKDGQIYEATEVKAIDLDREYKLIFGKAATRYKQNIYQLTFDVGSSKPFSLGLCNGEYRTELCW